MPLVEAQARFDERLGHGGSLAEVEEEIIDSAPVSEEQRAALWLYASATMPVHVAEAVTETARRPSSRLGWLSTRVRSGNATLSRALRKSPRSKGKAPHGEA
jgi:hypothetical protein